ncbi:hypothetical protein ACFQZZ_07195 [Nocardia sp. GCM10030253]|uniref:hypothetical protein n=1 Tax=Nocardia sp. GCM10030253 TaxID=3273404 RepID=UPI0036450A0E
MSAESRDEPVKLVVDTALAEFSALRHELDELGRGQRTVMSLNITATAAIVTFILSQRVPPQLLLVVPYVSVALGLLYQTYTIHAQHLGEYINERIRPVLVEKCQDDRVFGWEGYIRGTIYRTGWSQLPMKMAFILVIPVIPLASLVCVLPVVDSAWHWLAWVGGVLLYATQLASWARLSRQFLWV